MIFISSKEKKWLRLRQLQGEQNSAYNLRFYEKEGLISVPRTKAGIRDFDEATESRINAIRHYRCAGLSLHKLRSFCQYR